MLTRIPYSLYSLAGLINLCENLIKKAKSAHADEAMIMAISNKLELEAQEARKALGTNTGSVMTGSIAKADDLRDACYRSLRITVKAGLSRITNGRYQEACSKIWEVFQGADKQLTNLPYREETEALKSLLNQLDNLTSEIEAVGLTSWVTELRESNEDFDKLLNSRTESQAKDTTPTDHKAKNMLTDDLKIFESTIESLWAFGQPAGIKDTVDQLNQIIKEANLATK